MGRGLYVCVCACWWMCVENGGEGGGHVNKKVFGLMECGGGEGGRGTEGGMTRIMCWSKTQLTCPQPAVEQAAEGCEALSDDWAKFSKTILNETNP
jgi:hypothetical protein